ncbi:FAD-binding and (Fe-S)-binding domain-containing protein [soil metagenome]
MSTVHLPAADTSPATFDRDQLATDLAKLISGPVKFRDHDRRLYSTDASIFQVEPIGVVVPANVDEAAAVLKYCADRRVPVLPRGGGTSLAGQCTSRAVVIDLSALCRRMLSIDSANRICQAEAGITIDEINRVLAREKTNLFYAPDPATIAQAALGGTIGNNAAGARSLRYGRTSENVAGVEVILASGERTWLEPGAGRRDPIALRLARGVARVCIPHAAEIRSRFPKTIRRNAGYGLDMIVNQLMSGVAVEDLDLSPLICGSEGTLAMVIAAKLKLHVLPIARGLAIASFSSLNDAVDRVSAIVATRPTAVELIDDVVLEAALGNLATRPLVDLLPRIDGAIPRFVLYVEYSAERSLDEIDTGFAALREVCPLAPIAEYRDADSLARAWTLRKSGEPLLHGISAKRKPQTFVEDNAIPLENLSRFVREFQEIVKRHDTTAAYWAHASVGVLHVRPMVDVHDPGDRKIMQSIAIEVADLARDCGGVMSGEHGDGRIRGPLLERFFGPQLMQAFRDVKEVFDPNNVLNPGNIVKPGPIESITQRLRILPADREVFVPDVDTFFTYEDQHGFGGAVEMCNGAGFCRKLTGGTMCPSYRVTLDEEHSTRGRANALRMAITGQASSGQANADGSTSPDWSDAGTIETLDLCLSCKACKAECPSNVDVARLKAEYTGQRYREHGAPLLSRVMGRIRPVHRLASLAPRVFNWANRNLFLRRVINRTLGLAPQRSIPEFAPSLYRWFGKRRATADGDRPIVVLYADCFTTYNEPHIGRAAVEVLEALGYEVRFPKIGCCARSMISLGMMDHAIRTADATLEQLLDATSDPRVRGLVVCEPSCLSAIKDDWLQLKLSRLQAERQALAGRAFLVEEFVERFWNEHPIQPQIAPRSRGATILHGHCHQKALWGDSTSAAALRRFVGDQLAVLPSGCCGMAGSFGYAAHRYDLSMKIGELSVFPPIRESPDATIVAPGTSCRHQIRDGTGRIAMHPIELIARGLSKSGYNP